MSETSSICPNDKLTLENVAVVYSHRKKKVVALENLNFRVANKEFLAILGPSGCGKSTALHLVAGFIQPTKGEVRLNGNYFVRPVLSVLLCFNDTVFFHGKQLATTSSLD